MKIKILFSFTILISLLNCNNLRSSDYIAGLLANNKKQLEAVWQPEIDGLRAQVNELRAKVPTIADLIATNQFGKAQLLAEQEPKDLEAIKKIKRHATSHIEDLARKCVLLSSIPELAEKENKQAMDIISSFPEGHDLRMHLQRRYEEIRRSFSPQVSGEAELAVLQRMTARLFDDGE